MVLYDGNYNFLGMSEKLLNKLGFDDLNEFNSYYKDFADLFEKENGFIYKFQNFSWIDFILYGGANKDTAIIKDKSNNRIKVRLNINEILLKEDIKGAEKFYSVILEDEEILSKEEENTIQNSQKPIDITSMLIDDSITKDTDTIKQGIQTVKESVMDINVEKQQNHTMGMNKINNFEDEDNSNTKQNSDDLSINLSFLNQNQDQNIKEDKNKIEEDSFSLDFFNNNKIQNPPQESIEKEQILKQQNNIEQNKFTSDNEISIKNDIDISPIQLDKSANKDEDSEIVLNFFKSNIDDDLDNKNTLNILRENKLEETKERELDIYNSNNYEDNSNLSDLNFLKLDMDESTSRQESELGINLEALKNFRLNEDKQEFEEKNKQKDFATPQKEKESDVKEKLNDINIDLNFLKDENKQDETISSNFNNNIKKESNSNEADLNFEFDFLKDAKINKMEEETKQKINTQNNQEINLNFLKIEEERNNQNTTQNLHQTQNITPSIKDKESREEPQIDLNILKLDNLEEQNKQTKESEKLIDLDKIESININNIQQNQNKTNDLQNIDNNINQKKQKNKKSKKKEFEIKVIDNNQSKIVKQDKDVKNQKNEERKEEIKVDINNNIKMTHKEKVSIQAQQKVVSKEENKDIKEEFPFLKNLNISIENKREILKDFINDVTHSIKLAKAFFAERDYDSIQFITIKAQSSAEILELKDMHSVLDDLGFYVRKKDDNNIQKTIEAIENQINNLKRFCIKK